MLSTQGTPKLGFPTGPNRPSWISVMLTESYWENMRYMRMVLVKSGQDGPRV